MHVLSDGFLDAVNGKNSSMMGDRLPRPVPVINIHPALPGTFDGATNAIVLAYEAFQRGEITKSGINVHRVIKEVDRGESVIVKEVEMENEESLESFEQRMHRIEWEVIVQATAKVLGETPS